MRVTCRFIKREHSQNSEESFSDISFELDPSRRTKGTKSPLRKEQSPYVVIAGSSDYNKLKEQAVRQ